MTVFSNDILFTTPSETATTATFTYDGADPGDVTIRVYGAIVGHTYGFSATDPNSSDATVVAAEANFVFTLTGVGGFLIPLNFDVNTYDDTSGQWVGGTIFTTGSTQEYPNGATWTYDGGSTVIVSFPTQVGNFYQLSVSDAATSAITTNPLAGTGGVLTINLDFSPTQFEGSFVANLYYRQQVDA